MYGTTDSDPNVAATSPLQATCEPALAPAINVMRAPTRQRERRRHIIGVTLSIARAGGYEAVRMRVVAQRADVALGTLYRYFPSKPNLMLSVLEHELDRIERKVRSATAAADRYERVWLVINQLNTEMVRDPRLAAAMARAFMDAYVTKCVEADRVRHRLDTMFAHLIAGGKPNPVQQQMGRIIVDTWVSNALHWLNHRATPRDINERLWQLLAIFAGRADMESPAWPTSDPVADEPDG